MIGIILGLFVVVLPVTAFAAPEKEPGTAERGVDAVLLMDSSGSMKKTDPQGRRKPAARLFISLLGNEDRAGIVSFSSYGEILLGLTDAGGKEQKSFVASVEKVNSRGPYTNILDAVKRGHDVLSSSTKKDRVMILMSDGQMDVGSSDQDKALSSELITKLLPEISKSGIKVYTIAFTDQSDQPFLEEIARKTGGAFRVARTDADLHLVFASVFEKIKTPDLIPLRGGSFSIDKNIQEVTLLITRKSPSTAVIITDPQSRRLTSKKPGPDVQWFGSGVFDMVTVKRPLPGIWGVRFNSDEGNKVFVITDLRLRSSFNVDFVPEGRKLMLDAWIEKEGKPLDNRVILEHIRFSASMKSPGSEPVPLKLTPASGEGAKPGVYQAEFTADRPGDYAINLLAEAETFRREKDFIFKVIKQAQPVPAAPVVQAPPRKVEPRDPPVQWSSVLLTFAAINGAIFLLIAGAYCGRKYLHRTRGTPR